VEQRLSMLACCHDFAVQSSIMSHQANRVSPRAEVIAQLQQLVGLPLSAARRAADMRTLQFGALKAVGRGSMGEFSLHIQCPWRIEGPDGIVTGRLDLWEPVDRNFDFDFESWDYEKSPNLQDTMFDQLMAQHEQSLVVQSVDADDCGGAAITFHHGFVLRIFPAGSRGEDWRLLSPGTDSSHFVIAEGKVEV
jgi:hypothetical protein